MLEHKHDPSILIDRSIEAAWGDTPKAVNTDWRQSEIEDASQPVSLDFSGR